ncbi:cytochrome c oxidase subunit 7A1, mitochondrial-like [Notamacropus eugenii]|uniref:cytochrome c oxidase subunit 7A1, mitochondrial-like n=1 Tax=Notamacropus eugenii TaxID=9315 RepID=UPI003B6857FE
MRGLLVSHSRGLLRSFSSSARNLFENRVAEKQKLFQENNDLPVYLKGGPTDRILYSITMLATIGGTGYSLFFLVWASFPHQNTA